MSKKTDIDIFYEYLNTADIVYKDNICITDLNTRKHKDDVIQSLITDVIINPNRTFTVYFGNGDKNVFELYTTVPHFYKVENPDFKKIAKHTMKETK